MPDRAPFFLGGDIVTVDGNYVFRLILPRPLQPGDSVESLVVQMGGIDWQILADQSTFRLRVNAFDRRPEDTPEDFDTGEELLSILVPANVAAYYLDPGDPGNPFVQYVVKLEVPILHTPGQRLRWLAVQTSDLLAGTPQMTGFAVFRVSRSPQEV